MAGMCKYILVRLKAAYRIFIIRSTGPLVKPHTVTNKQI